MSDETNALSKEEEEVIVRHLTDSIEFYKMRVDLFKHLSTLSSGSVVVLVAFSKDLHATGSNSFLLAALVCLIVAIVFSAWTCFHTLGTMIKTKELLNGISSLDDLLRVERGNWVNWAAMGSFLLSMVFLVISIFQKMPAQEKASTEKPAILETNVLQPTTDNAIQARTSDSQSEIAEQGGADQPATAPESKPEGNQKPEPESEVRPQ